MLFYQKKCGLSGENKGGRHQREVALFTWKEDICTNHLKLEHFLSDAEPKLISFNFFPSALLLAQQLTILGFLKEPLTIDSDYVLMYENYSSYLRCFAYLAGANAGQTAPGCVPNLPQIVFSIVFAMAYVWPAGLQCNLTISGVVWGELIIRVKALSKQGMWGECSAENSCGGNTASPSLQLRGGRA